MAKPNFPSIQVLRACAALLVVIFHLRIVEAKYGEGETLLPSWLSFADGGVDLFFVISGFVMVTIAAGRYRSCDEAAWFLLRRAWRILPPYWVYTTVVVALMTIAPGMVNTSYQNQSVLASYLLWPQVTLPILTVGWTLIHEAYFYLAMALAVAFVPERKLPYYLSAWAILTALGAYLLNVGTPGLALLTSPMTWEFILGALVGVYWRRIPAAGGLPLLIVGVAGFLAGMVWLDLAGLTQHGGGHYRVPVFGAASAMIVAGAVVWESLRYPRVARLWLAIGNSSYSLYLSHVFVISAIGRLWHMTSFKVAPWQHAAFIVVVVVASIVVGLASYRWLERPLLLFGERYFKRRPEPAQRSHEGAASPALQE